MNCNITTTTLEPITLGELKRMRLIANLYDKNVYHAEADVMVHPDEQYKRDEPMTIGIKIFHNEYDYEWMVDDDMIPLEFEDKGQADEWLRLEGFREHGVKDSYEIVVLPSFNDVHPPVDDLAEYWLAVFGDDDPSVVEMLEDPHDGQLITPDML